MNVRSIAMRPNLYPRLVNGRFGDPALFVEMLHRRDALLFDLGDLSRLSARDLLRITHVFVSHMHIDHFVGFDALLRANVGREKLLKMLGPTGIIERTAHKLKGYDWDLVERYQTELVFEVAEIGAWGCERAARFSFKRAFGREEIEVPPDWDRPANLELSTALLQHHGPCLGFAVSEPMHVNVWKSRLKERGLPTGQWLQQLKNAVLAGEQNYHPIELPDRKVEPLGALRDLVTVSRGQKIAYVTDVADSKSNRTKIANLARDADLLFLEARFAAEDAEVANQRAHLTTTAAGEIAREAGARRIEPFHFSPRYEDEERMVDEVWCAFESELDRNLK